MGLFEHTPQVDRSPPTPCSTTSISLPATQGQRPKRETDDGASVLGCCYGSSRVVVTVNFTLECEQEVDGRWIAEVPELPGVLSYGESAAAAMSKAEILALRVIADRLENSESEPVSISFSLPISA